MNLMEIRNELQNGCKIKNYVLDIKMSPRQRTVTTKTMAARSKCDLSI